MAPLGPRILFITSSRIGDAVLSTGLLDWLVRTHPDCRITVACGTGALRLTKVQRQGRAVVDGAAFLRGLHRPWTP